MSASSSDPDLQIVTRLDVMLALQKKKSKDLAAYIGITEQNLSIIKLGKAKGIRFETMAKICDFFDCQPGDLFEFVRAGPAGGRPE